MHLYTRTDLERCARLACQHLINDYFASGSHGIEMAVGEAVDEVSDTTPEVFERGVFEDAVRSAAYLALQGLPVEDVVKNVLLGVRA